MERFRLISCHTCGWRFWAVAHEGEDYRDLHEHDDLWEDHTFYGMGRGPGLPLVQLGDSRGG